jgi:parallel beta-helix repeat protein
MKRLFVFRLFLAAALAFSLFSGAAPAPARAENQIQSTFTVNDDGDEGDDDAADCSCGTAGGLCTLRAAIQTANICSIGAPHTITFNGNYTIRPVSDLPPLNRNSTTLSGVGHTILINPADSNSTTRGLAISGDNIAVHHLWIQNFGTGIIVYGSFNIIGLKDDNDGNENQEGNTLVLNSIGVNVDSGSYNQVSGNFIGVDNAGSLAYGNYSSGIAVSTSFTTIGTDGDGNFDSWEGNVISNNTDYGIYVTSAGDYTTISGNTIGISAKAGITAAPNGLGGINIAGSFSRIGTNGDNQSDDVETNVISGNGSHGIHVSGGSGQKISGNLIGLPSIGSSVVANSGSGIRIAETAYNVTIGVDESSPAYSANERNIISGNTVNGIDIYGYQNTVAGNYIGLSESGTLDKGNNESGIYVGGHDNTLGTDSDNLAAAYEGNVISGNNLTGIFLGPGGDSTIIAGNIIGLNAAGSAALPNTYDGVKIAGSAVGTRIGSNGDGVADGYERNIISGNGYNGIDFAVSAEGYVGGNYIGTDKLGTSDLGNGRNGIYIEPGNNEIITIGVPNGGVAAQSNVISGNTQSGIYLLDADNHIIAGNYIGVDLNGGSALPNGNNGIRIVNSQTTRIGTDANGQSDSLEKNLISANAGYGISINGASSINNTISGNWIGLDAAGANAIANSNGGIGVSGNAANTRIGTNGDGTRDNIEGNNISGNSFSGITLIEQSGTVIAGNTIGLSVSCSPCTKIPNDRGIWIQSPNKEDNKAVGSVRIGTNADGVSDTLEVNYISGNSIHGIQIDAGAGHVIAGNLIGLDRNGNIQANSADGVYLSASAGSGTRVGTDGDGVNDGAERNVISGNTNFGVRISASSIVVAGNYIGTSQNGLTARANGLSGVLLDGSSNIIGVNGNGSAGEVNEGNTISGNGARGIEINSGLDNRVSGNRIGVNVTGTAALPNTSHGVYIQLTASGSIIGSNGDGTSDALEGNIISGNTVNGIQLYSPDSTVTNTRITGNTIGLGSNKETAFPNGGRGIILSGTANTVIGLEGEGQRNLISANQLAGIYTSGANSNLQITGNRIGITASGQAAGNGSDGIYISGITKSEDQPLGTVGPLTIIQSNTLHNNSGAGVYVDLSAGNGHKIFGNSFDNNGGLGIDLFPSGVTANDAGDPDSGANGLQNHPVVASVEQPSSSSLRVTGSFNSTANTSFTIQLYATTSVDPSGFGEGLDPIHSFSLSTDGSGGATFDQTFTCWYGTSRSDFTAIAIAPDGSTSEFGPTLHVDLGLNPIHLYLPMIAR